MTPISEVIRLAREAAARHGHTLKDEPEKETLEFITELVAMAKAEALAEGWQPIETAPLDKTVLVYPPTWPSVTCSTAKFNADTSAKKPRPFWERNDALRLIWKSREVPPTHWRPLPPPPKEAP